MITTNTGSPITSTSQHMTVKQAGPLAQVRWATMRTLFSTLGRTSKGIRTGYTFGFDSGTMLDYVYVNQAQGSFGIGKLLDRLYLNAIGWRAIRARSVLLKEMLRAEVELNCAEGHLTRLLDVAAGPGRYLQELLQECDPARGDLYILCRDLSIAGLAQGAARASAAGLQTIHYEQGDAFNPAPTEDLLGGSPNIIVVSGLYELMLDDETIQQSLTRLYELLEPGGSIYFTTQTHHPQLDFIANVLPNRDGVPWVMKCRRAEQLEEWAYDAGFNQIKSRFEQHGLFSITHGKKLVPLLA